MAENKYCLVHDCKYSKYHLTEYHTCSLCGLCGHGKDECGNNDKINNLKKFGECIPVSDYCTITNCNNPSTHLNESHLCDNCFEYGHGKIECKNNPKKIIYSIKCPICCTINNVDIDKKSNIKDQNCVVCYDNTADMILSKCGHSILCFECVENIYKCANTNIDTNSNTDAGNNIAFLSLLPREFYERTAYYRSRDRFLQPTQEIIDIIEHPEWLYHFKFDGTPKDTIEGAKIAFNDMAGKIFLCSDADMGCYYFAKRDDMNNEIKTFFMHSDNWGQYRKNSVEDLCRFIHGYKFIKKSQ
jgi:hypothetical protein